VARRLYRQLGPIPIACGLLAVALTLGSVAASIQPRGWSLTALPRVDAKTAMGAAATLRDPGFRTVSPGAYDGQWYWGIAVDPLATGDVHRHFDNAAYRYSHPLYGWLGWLLSAGQARAVPAALLAIGLVSMLVAGAAAGLLGGRAGGSGWQGLFVALNPGLLYASSHDLTEPLSAALLLTGLLAYVDGRRRLAIVLFALLVLSKEPFVAVPLGLAVWELVRRRERLRSAATLLVSVVPALAVWIWVRLALGAWFTSAKDSAFVFPLSGWKRALQLAGEHSYSADPTQNQFGEATIVVIVALGGLLLVTWLLALALRGPVDAAFILLGVTLACLSPVATTYERDLLRAAAVPLVLVPLILARLPLRPAFARARPD
jgi:hypothetical protein